VPPPRSIAGQASAEYVALLAVVGAIVAGAAAVGSPPPLALKTKVEAAELEKSKATTGFSSPLKVSRNDAQGMPPAALSAIYKADAQKLPAYVGVDLGDDGYAIYRVNAVVSGGAVDPQRLAAAQQQIAQVQSQSEAEAYVEALRARSKVKLYGSLESSGNAQASDQ